MPETSRDPSLEARDAMKRPRNRRPTPAAQADQPYFPLGITLSRQAWDRFGLEELASDIAIDDPERATAVIRELAYRMSAAQQDRPPHEEPPRPGHLQGFALLETILRYVADLYCIKRYPGVMNGATTYVRNRRGVDVLEGPVNTFVHLFPPHSVQLGLQTPQEALRGHIEGQPALNAVTREIALLSIVCANPALQAFRDLFDDAELRHGSPLDQLVPAIEEFFALQPALDPPGQTLLECLRAPLLASPDSLDGQIQYVRDRWASLLPPHLMHRLFAAQGAVREEIQYRGPGPGPPQVLRKGRGLGGETENGLPETERFTADADWMSSLVLIAKITYVWLDQLSKQHQRPITRLDQIPDEELDRLASCGFTGLWLIGLWERSRASEFIKRRTGNPEAAASAYSMYDYVIAGDLGGEDALEDLRARAWQRGIRLASDMVPNHVGIYSKWIIEHPDWFVQCDRSPFPSYSFTGPDVSLDDRVSLFIEDGYWNHTDAAVVFKRVDNRTGDTRYIYHGNDGTNMPWNDTAQLNYLLPEVREAVIQTILHVVRQFPIVRFDAAMTLTKRHFQRLWFPCPGEAGAIPSRSEHSMTAEEFDAAFPGEFWRQAVDGVQAEVPGVLLLAEAFWLMEGYFVRTLGMHRVYNSAFMNMLKTEDNLKYRMTVKNVLEYSPEVLKRFVNFMNNPDELTAVEQFGKGDKYFGVAVMMATMPGLPMFGHGQIEGFTEKYGMEYRRAYWNEQADEDTVRRHEREVFPLLRKRHLFSSAADFAFYDFIHPDDYVDENVFAFSNRAGDERVVVLYNNALSTTRGRIHTSTAVNIGLGDETNLVHRTLVESLGLRSDPGVYYIFRAHGEGLQYIRESRELAEQGLFVELRGYQYHLFLDFQEVFDSEATWSRVADRLQGAGVPDIRVMHREVVLAPVADLFREAVSVNMVRRLASACLPKASGSKDRARLRKAMDAYLATAESELGVTCDRQAILDATERELAALHTLRSNLARTKLKQMAGESPWPPLPETEGEAVGSWRIPIVWAIVHHLEEALAVNASAGHSSSWADEWLLTPPIAATFAALGREDWLAREDTLLVMLLARYTPTLLAIHENEPDHLVAEMFEDVSVRDYLYVNEFDGVVWFNREQLETALSWMIVTSAAATLTDEELTPSQQAAIVRSRRDCVRTILETAHEAGYQVDALLALLARPA